MIFLIIFALPLCQAQSATSGSCTPFDGVFDIKTQANVNNFPKGCDTIFGSVNLDCAANSLSQYNMLLKNCMTITISYYV